MEYIVCYGVVYVRHLLRYILTLIIVVKYLVNQINLAAKEIEKIEKLLPKNHKNLVLRKDLIQILVKDLAKKEFDVFAIHLNAKSFSTKIKLLLKMF